jgi:putative restriction endonuclease
VIDHEQRAGRLWPVLTKTAKAEDTITYGAAANAIEIHHRPIRYVLGEIQDYCISEGLPPLTALVVSAATGRQGAGYLGVPGRQADIDAVWAFDWGQIGNPFGENAMAVIEAEAELLVGNPDAASDVYSRVRARGDQQRIFRAALMKAYGGGCAICGLTFDEVLEAAHIIPWSTATPELRVDPRNGILLCANHHRLLDSGWINILDNFEVEYDDPDQKWEPYSDADRLQTVDFHGKHLRLPADRRLWPEVNLLHQRRQTRSRRRQSLTSTKQRAHQRSLEMRCDRQDRCRRA